ncbi:AAA family ATPase [Sorangium sp. So ce233]|uniref:AAA family ATPase n=1 Tax=Sorangium sp. So ce233 TaxID=3133290 RepID=UPI003F5E69D0
MTTWVIGVVGGIAAGKSTFCAALADALDAEVTGFGAFVREHAAERGLDSTSREVLQPLGERLKEELGADEFARRVLGRARLQARVVVDGIRHVDIVDALKEAAAPRPFALVFLDADDETCQQRASTRPEGAARLQELAAHSTEQQVHDGSLRERADLVLDARLPVGDLVDATMNYLSRRSVES